MTSDTNNTICWMGLSRIPGVGRATFRRLVKSFGSAGAVLGASRDALQETGGISEKTANEIASASWRAAAEEEMERARKAGVAVVTIEDAAYPENLRTAPDAPLFLYIKGSLLAGDRRAVAIVGTRTPTYYGLTLTHRMAYGLAAAGATVVSGMARGIDTQAHKGAIAAKGRTIAVLACGIDTVYPPENRDLMERIAGSGAVITENPFGTRPESGYFPARNRIISGLSSGTVIVEAASDSGSLITADYTVKQGRKLFAVPGNAGAPTSRGTNSLIKQGAVLVETAEDIVAHLGIRRGRTGENANRPLHGMSDEEASVLKVISDEPKHIDAIMTQCGIAPGKLSGVLTALELQGLVRQLPGKYFARESDRTP
jgi:DNA processing protein